ncbi:MAG: type II methionyl aminopeptidase [Candidatus Pacearchaeota archaeon]|jgi:methionyl aminopeptidase
MNNKDIENIRKAGKIAREVKEYARRVVKKGELLRDIADKIEAKIVELGGKWAFPVNLGINEVTAHYIPAHDDVTVAGGLLKVDFGVQIDGWTADTAFSVDLESGEESEKNKKLIKSSEEALANAIKAVEEGKGLGEIGAAIQMAAEKYNANSIKNLSGHMIEQYALHAGLNIPNYDTGSPHVLDNGLYAIEPFITYGSGMVYDGKPSGIYEVRKVTGIGIRDSHAREVFEFILKEYETLPFCSRWLVKKFGTRALLSLSMIERTGALYQFATLVEKSKSKVAQSEHTLLITQGKVEVIT